MPAANPTTTLPAMPPPVVSAPMPRGLGRGLRNRALHAGSQEPLADGAGDNPSA